MRVIDPEEDLMLTCVEMASYEQDPPDELLDRIEHLINVVRRERDLQQYENRIATGIQNQT